MYVTTYSLGGLRMDSNAVSMKVQQTRRLIAASFMELMKSISFKKVSVNDICENALISRSTFYHHFEDKYQLLRYCMEGEAKRWLTVARDKTVEDAVACALDSILENKNFYHHIISDDSNTEEIGILHSIFVRFFTDRLLEKERAGFVLPGPASILGAFYAGGIVSANNHWILRDFNIPKEEMVECQKNLLSNLFG